MKPISIIIPTLNEERYLPHLLGSIFVHTKGERLEIIVVDALSDDKTQEVVEQYRKCLPRGMELRLLTTAQRNIALQRNFGAHQARYDILLFLDADTRIPSSEAFTTLMRAFLAREHAAASCHFTAAESDWRGKIYFFVWSQFTRLMQYYDPNVLGACIITTKKVFEQCGGFDHTITVGEDANYCARSREFGRFRILPARMEVSARRFRKHGYAAMALEYTKIFFYRTFFGEYRIAPSQRYDFGKFSE